MPARVHSLRAMPRTGSFSLTIIAACLLAFGAQARDTNWATRIEKPGLPNLHRVSDLIYRSAQPTTAGMRNAERMGIKTVISLRAFHSDRDEIKSSGLRRERISFNTWHPEEEDVLEFLRLVTKTNNGPYLVHCLHGADRTGTMIGIYRMTVQGWTKDEAIAEMTKGNFGYHTIWKNLIGYLNELDIPALRRKAGLPNPMPRR
jgi:protein tyrosine/serine phosphatase